MPEQGPFFEDKKLRLESNRLESAVDIAALEFLDSMTAARIAQGLGKSSGIRFVGFDTCFGMNALAGRQLYNCGVVSQAGSSNSVSYKGLDYTNFTKQLHPSFNPDNIAKLYASSFEHDAEFKPQPCFAAYSLHSIPRLLSSVHQMVMTKSRRDLQEFLQLSNRSYMRDESDNEILDLAEFEFLGDREERKNFRRILKQACIYKQNCDNEQSGLMVWLPHRRRAFDAIKLHEFAFGLDTKWSEVLRAFQGAMK